MHLIGQGRSRIYFQVVNYAPWQIPKFIVDKKVPYTSSLFNLKALEKGAGEGMQEIKQLLLEHV